ncbi:hypothetical protein RUMHYD_01834 [Blautia hydrogenotrophica DSM 10507]|uniref:Uncharacterized protein n=1 Tax=Blautia hydrogenotrophica (strain DSM 10507 / JCM 14656 / S5a33) TaxID=476272 RepID=C0CLW1_BLAHS|nr:hypothetical protein RUMHYD_01834 [Blautia hydrogenotrophica DSM 10507]
MSSGEAMWIGKTAISRQILTKRRSFECRKKEKTVLEFLCDINIEKNTFMRY